LKVVATKAVDSHYYLSAFVFCAKPELVRAADFVVDTGASTTTLVAENLDIDCSKLEKADFTVMTAKGPQIPFVLRDIVLVMRSVKRKLVPVELATVDVIREHIGVDGLLGMDVLDKFKKFTGDRKHLTLDK
jgi:predicted aspartyl protease